MNTPTELETLARARAEEATTRAKVRELRNALRRFARKHKLTLTQARRQLCIRHRDEWLALIQAESAHDQALREFRRVALLTAVERICRRDRLARRAAELEPVNYLTFEEFLRVPKPVRAVVWALPAELLRRTYTRLALPAPAAA